MTERFTTEAVPRLKRGCYKKGPEFYGCCNTGTRPVLYFCRKTETKPGGRPYIVCGAELNLDDARCYFWTRPRKRVYRVKGGMSDDRRVCYAFKTRKAAVAKFVEMCNDRLDENARVRAEHEAALEGAKRGDVGAALSLIDY